MEVNCYVCHNKAKNWSQNLVKIKSKHSQTPIAEFVLKFLGDYQTDRNLYHHTNCICNDCLSKIYAYDWTCIKAKEQEAELRTVLLKTESVFKSLQFEGDAKQTRGAGPANPLNGVVHIIADEDYNNDDAMDDKANVRAEVQTYSASKSTSAAEPEIQKTRAATVRKTSSAVDIKSEPTAMCDMKPKIEKPPTTAQPQPKIVSPKVEPPKKGKPIIVRVVKRVPFLKPNSSTATSQPNPATATTSPSEPLSNANDRVVLVSTTTTTLTTVKKSPAKKTAIGKQPPICKYCDGRFPNQMILQNHLKLHTKYSGSITCHICFYQMNADKDAFMAHIKKHSKVPPKHCVLCSEGGAEGFDLRQHVQTDHNDANLLCDLCGKTFAYSSALSKHRKSHFDERLEQCPHCPKSFKLKRSLKEHMDIHLNTEPAFACAFCDRRFKRKDHLRVHERRHRGDTKRFKCTLCTAAFEYKHDFNLHLQRKHDAEMPHDKRR